MKNSRVVTIFLTLVVGLGLGWVVHDRLEVSKSVSSALVTVRENSSDYKFINPLIFSKTSKTLYSAEFSGLIDSLNASIHNSQYNNDATDISVYYRDLNSGHWTGINEDETYEPASMLKVLVMIATLKQALADQNLLSRELAYTGPIDDGQYYKPADKLSAGPHTVQELINAMITDSNNGAAAALLNDKEINDAAQSAYNVFLLPPATTATTTDYMSARSYSVVFRTLFDSSYLTWDLSEQALALLADTGYTKGLVAGVPIGTVVAHKFGEFTKVAPDGTASYHELHDCGVVYYPEHPYLLCVMTRGGDFGKLESVVSGLSQLVYNYVNTTSTAGK